MLKRFIAALVLLAAPAARADVTSPHPGMVLVNHPGVSALVFADLCAPGVSMRATRWSERQATPQQWAQGVGAQAAVNADFFEFPGWSWILVRARGAGEEWPASAEQLLQPSGYWQFGSSISGLQPNSLVTPPPEVTDVVGSYDPLITNGQPVDQSTNPFMLEFHRRTAIGLSADRATVFLYASNVATDGPGMIGDMIAMAAEGGAPPIADASNQDGGGSSQLYVQNLGQVIDSGRQVADHLGIFATGSGPAPNCPNHAPVGFLDGVACDGFAGWSQDPDAPQKPIDVHVYFDGPAGAAQAQGIPLHADVSRPDLCGPLGSCNHAFTLLPPLSHLDGKPHEVHAYGIDSSGGRNAELAQSPRTMQCNPMAVSGVRRWIHSPDVMTAWHFSWFADVMPVSDDVIASLREETQIPDAPALIRADDGSPEVWLVDGDIKRHVPDIAAAAAWHFDLGQTVVKPASYVASLPTGMPLRSRPIAIQGSGPKVFLVDDAHDASPDAGVTGVNPVTTTSGCSCDVPSDGRVSFGALFATAALIALAIDRRRRIVR